MMIPPILGDDAPWKERFRTKGTLWTTLARENPERGLVCSNESGIYQLYAWEVPSGALTQITSDPTGKSSGSISPDGSFIYYLADQGGNEIGRYVRVGFHGGDREEVTRHVPPYSSWGLNTGRSGKMIGFITADGQGYHLFVATVGDGGNVGAPRKIHHNGKLTQGPTFSRNDEIAVVTTTERSETLHFGIQAIDTSTGTLIAELWEEGDSSVQAAFFSPLPGDFRLLAVSDRSGSKRPFLWDPYTGERIDLEVGSLAGEVFPLDWSRDGKMLLLCQVEQAVQKFHLYDLSDMRLVTVKQPDGTGGLTEDSASYFGPENEIYTQWQDSANPPRTVAIDPQSGDMRTIFAPAEVPPGHAWKSITFTSSDGQQIQGWLGLPDGQGPFPTILHTHGGPDSVAIQTFAPGSQAWMDHGYAFLTINYRGSTTFGKKFEEQIWGNPGRWEIEDMKAARDWLVDNGIADPGRIFVTGASYGGYLTLLALGRLPDLWAGGMAIVAIADWTLLYEDEADMIRGFQRALFGGTPTELPEQHRISSPITYAGEVQAPLLVIQGRNDTRCPERQMEVYEARMRDLGKSIEVHWFKAGHLSLDIQHQIYELEEMLKFTYRVLQEQVVTG
jgi:dipeptidyl aminopeptidase/acylaminoacyl peptidase